MKKAIIAIIGGLVVLVGIFLISYPFVCNYFVNNEQESAISYQNKTVSAADDSLISDMLKQAREYNKRLIGNSDIKDPFADDSENGDDEYDRLLNINNDSLMASVEIPKINVKLAIYHGTSKEVLEKGAGHLKKSSLPIGGKGTHAVITGHTGLSNAAMFSDLDKLENGDVFFINVLDRVLAYEVDKIKIVLPSDTSELKIESDKDYVTLVTCTPSGVNSHRLLVRGKRIPLDEAEEIAKKTSPAESTWMLDYKKIVIISAVAFIALLIIILITRRYIVKRHRNEKT